MSASTAVEHLPANTIVIEKETGHRGFVFGSSANPLIGMLGGFFVTLYRIDWPVSVGNDNFDGAFTDRKAFEERFEITDEIFEGHEIQTDDVWQVYNIDSVEGRPMRDVIFRITDVTTEDVGYKVLKGSRTHRGGMTGRLPRSAFGLYDSNYQGEYDPKRKY